MRIAVTGAAGFLGSRVAKKFINDGHNVLKVMHKVTDIANLEAVRTALTSFNAECVAHCAAIADIGLCENDRELANRVNIVGTRNIASVCADLDAVMVFVSSDQVYDYRSLERLNEYTPTKPLNYYGFTKVEGENAARAVVKKHFMARIAWQYDFARVGMDGISDNGGGLWRLAEQAVKKGGKLSYGLNNRRSLNYVRDTVDALAAMAEGKLPYGVYNVASPNDLTEEQTYSLMLKAVGAEDNNVRQMLTCASGEAVDLRAEPLNLSMSGYRMPTVVEGINRCINDRSKFISDPMQDWFTKK